MAELEYTLKINPELKNILNNQAMQAGLTAVGMKLEEQAAKNITWMKVVDTGRLRGSITYKTKLFQSEPKSPATKEDIIKTMPQDNEVYIGTNVKYAPYIEYGVQNPKFPPVDALKGWAKRKLGDEKLAFVVARSLSKKQREPKAFLRTALDQWRAKISDVFAASYKKVVDSQK